ncbi:MAG: Glu-tRNA(Gln) amidotransferase subunit GatE [Candidatus Micrarchaeota archaeon]|nr:Glu-tRNA(Gln) amidotransferase subunit GatE [Candidatus Micrarchaeota archaeon]
MKCGIEIHQRIAGRKLFCRCPSPSDHPSSDGSKAGEARFTRRLHAVLSELGEMDAAVRMESIRQRQFSYAASLNECCLVEADEEPPHQISQEALAAAVAICRLLKSKVVDELHVMRKNVIDGSNTSGFQRTALVGIGGEVETPLGKLAIQTVCLEEESAGIIEGKEGSAEYSLSRLGVPLVEIATEPSLSSGKQAQEAAFAIGSLLRKTGLVQRGIGSIRQDLNVSIPGGARVEIKGVQELSMIATTVDMEAARQSQLIQISKEAQKRLSGKPIEEVFVDLTEIFKETSCSIIGKAIRSGGCAMGLLLPKHEGLLAKEILPGRRYGTELSDYAKSAGIKGIIHSDENLSKYGITDDEALEVRAALSAKPSDAFVIAAGERRKAQAALSEVCRRANYPGVPEETRKANPDGTSSYMRPLPGKARLYPETDLPPLEIGSSILRKAEEEVRRMEKEEKEKAQLLSALNPQLSSQVSSVRGLISHNESFSQEFSSPEFSVFAACVKKGIDAKFAASVISNTLQALKREGAPVSSLDEPKLIDFFESFQKRVFSKSASPEILRAMCQEGISASQAAKKLGLQLVTGDELLSLISKEKLGISEFMAKHRLRVDAEEVQKAFKKIT